MNTLTLTAVALALLLLPAPSRADALTDKLHAKPAFDCDRRKHGKEEKAKCALVLERNYHGLTKKLPHLRALWGSPDGLKWLHNHHHELVKTRKAPASIEKIFHECGGKLRGAALRNEARPGSWLYVDTFCVHLLFGRSYEVRKDWRERAEKCATAGSWKECSLPIMVTARAVHMNQLQDKSFIKGSLFPAFTRLCDESTDQEGAGACITALTTANIYPDVEYSERQKWTAGFRKHACRLIEGLPAEICEGAGEGKK